MQREWCGNVAIFFFFFDGHLLDLIVRVVASSLIEKAVSVEFPSQTTVSQCGNTSKVVFFKFEGIGHALSS